MLHTFEDVNIFYKRHLGKGMPIILLHGWHGSHASFAEVFAFLALRGKDVISIDFPGFGASDVPPPDWDVYKYAECIESLAKSLKLTEAVVIGHSFGGRIGIILGKNDWVKKLMLIDSAGMKPRFSLKKQLSILRYKSAKRKGKDISEYGSTDYKLLCGNMRSIFVRVVNQHLEPELSSISCPTLLVWGDKDKDTPLYMAKRIRKNVRDCGLVILDGGHFSYLENSSRFSVILTEFIKKRS